MAKPSGDLANLMVQALGPDGLNKNDEAVKLYLDLLEQIKKDDRLEKEDRELYVSDIRYTLSGVFIDLKQVELAETLGVHESQVSRDERNEYFGITVERAARIFDVLGVEITTRVAKLPQLAKSA